MINQSSGETVPPVEKQGSASLGGSEDEVYSESDDGGLETRLEELHAMEAAYKALGALPSAARLRAFNWLGEALGVGGLRLQVQVTEGSSADTSATIGDKEDQVAPRQFIAQKKPASLVERVACLAYYLTHYRNLSYFKATDLVALNTEAASHKFGNPSRDIDNADRQNGYLAPAGNGMKQITVRGESVVEALPDREAVKAALKEHPHKQKRASSAKKTESRNGDDL